MYSFHVSQSPVSSLALTNKLYVNPDSVLHSGFVTLANDINSCVYSLNTHSLIPSGSIGLNQTHRKMNKLALADDVGILPFKKHLYEIKSLSLELLSGRKCTIEYSDFVTTLLTNLGPQHPLTNGQVFCYLCSGIVLELKANEIIIILPTGEEIKNNVGLITSSTKIMLTTISKNVEIVGAPKQQNALFKENIDMSCIGVGGLNDQIQTMFRRAFASRSISDDVVEAMGIKHVKGILLYGPPGCGKCLGKDTPVLMFDGSIKMVQDIEVGDMLMGDDSSPRTVLSLARGKETMYKIEQDDGDDYIVNESHILSLKMTVPKRMKKTKLNYKIKYYYAPEKVYRKKTFAFSNYEGNKDVAYQEAIKMLNSVTVVENVDVDVRRFVRMQRDARRALKGYKVHCNFPKSDLPCDPYVVGVLMASEFCINLDNHHSKEENEIISKFLSDCPNAIEATTMVLSKIPQEYKINNRNARLRLLAGIIDACGDIYKRFYRFSTQSEQIANDIMFVCRSLGFLCTTNKVVAPDEKNSYYRIKFQGICMDKIPVLLEKNKSPPFTKNVLTTKINIKKLGIDDYYGFEIDGNRRFLLGDFTVTHNTLQLL